MPRFKKASCAVLALVLIILLENLIIFKFVILMSPTNTNNVSISQQHLSTKEPKSRRVVVGAVCCRNGSVSLASRNKYNEQTTVMLKSLMISAKLYKIATIELHLFLEHVREDGEYFKQKIQEMGGFLREDKRGDEDKVILKVHSAVDAIPEKYRSHMIYHPRFRCGYVRFFFPTALPNVDSIIHLDSDMIITGNIMKHWEQLAIMKESQMIGLGYNRQPGNNNYLGRDQRWFGDIPHVPPRGVNAGLLIMNLTKLRKFHWEEKLSRLFEDYSKITNNLTGQRLLNMFLYYNPQLLKIIPCHLHFLSSACERGFYCEAATAEDPDGIHLVHGTDSRFRKGEVFHPIYYYYRKYNLTNPDADLFKSVMEPIKKLYATTYKTGPELKCFGTLNKVLFKRFPNDTNFHETLHA